MPAKWTVKSMSIGRICVGRLKAAVLDPSQMSVPSTETLATDQPSWLVAQPVT
jgi:hypothetical protein